MDLDDLSFWLDTDVMEALEEIDHGLTDRQMHWIGVFRKALDEHDELTTRQREVAEDILREWNEDYGDT